MDSGRQACKRQAEFELVTVLDRMVRALISQDAEARVSIRSKAPNVRNVYDRLR
jgi:hypothetical protein